jgi:hypothetical protein
MIVSLRGRPPASGDFTKNLVFGADHNFRAHSGIKRCRFGAHHACVAPRNYRSVGIKYDEMIRVALTDAAYDVIASTLPKGAARWPMERDRGQCFIQVEAAVIDRMRAMRRPGESYSEVILRLVELKTSDVK